MAAPQKPKQQGSRWGWMSQAVASVESGLDKILAEEEETSKKLPPRPARPQENGSSARASSEVKRSESPTKTNDRLQARLAQAMSKKAGSRATTPQPGSEPVSRPDTPGHARSESQVAYEGLETSQEQQKKSTEQTEPVNALEAVGIPTVDVGEVLDSQPEVKDSPDERAVASAEITRSSLASLRPSQDAWTRQSVSDVGSEADGRLLNAQLDHEKSLSALQEEINGYLERIDALQRNLQILTIEAIQNAKEVRTDSDASTNAKQLAEKDEKIALLIEEGTKLTTGEMQYRNTIKKLRSQTTTSAKDQEAASRRAEKAEKSVTDLLARAARAEAEAKKASSQLATLTKSSSDIEAITKERSALQSTLTEVRSQLSKANKRAEVAESNAQSDTLEAERRKTTELQDDLSSAKVERELAEDKLKREIEDLKQSLTREKDQARQMETEMLAEQAALESKLESFRVRAEEATSGDQSDSHAKLLRQIETLQSQYSAASQNWQGIESTLLARITALEKERDEVVGWEADMRRKLRDATSKAKTATKELEEVQQGLNILQDSHDEQKSDAQRAIKRVTQLEDEMAQLKKDFEDQRLRAEKDMVRRLEEERAKWIASMSHSTSRVDSPVDSLRKAPMSSLMDSLMSPIERPSSRRSFTQPFHDPNIPPSRINTGASMRTNGTLPETPTIMINEDQDDFFGNIPATPASAVPTHADSNGRAINDMISASTAGAGPSVQLVERLSTNVRRLESEKAASKDELTRLSSQRDEARQEVVNLMREVEAKRSAGDSLSKLENEHTALSDKYERTLELLGEKTEMVEELKADIMDIKQMYRQLADTMGK